MRILSYLLTLVFLSACTTIEVTKEVVKVGNVVKDRVEDKFQKKEIEIIEDKAIVEEQKIIIKKKEEEKTIVKTQQNLAKINFIGKTESEIVNQVGTPELTRLDGIVKTLRYDSKSCRLFLFFNSTPNVKRVEHFEFRNSLGELLNTKQSLETCYREYNLLN